MFSLEHDDSEIEARIKTLLREQQPIPNFILNRPRLAIGLDFYYEAFQNLCSERQPSKHGMFSLPWSVIQRYADHYELDFEEGEKFHYLISKMDSAYCNWSNKK